MSHDKKVLLKIVKLGLNGAGFQRVRGAAEKAVRQQEINVFSGNIVLAIALISVFYGSGSALEFLSRPAIWATYSVLPLFYICVGVVCYKANRWRELPENDEGGKKDLLQLIGVWLPRSWFSSLLAYALWITYGAVLLQVGQQWLAYFWWGLLVPHLVTREFARVRFEKCVRRIWGQADRA